VSSLSTALSMKKYIIFFSILLLFFSVKVNDSWASVVYNMSSQRDGVQSGDIQFYLTSTSTIVTAQAYYAYSSIFIASSTSVKEEYIRQKP